MEFPGCHEPVELWCHAGQLLIPTPAVHWLQQFTSARTHGNVSPWLCHLSVTFSPACGLRPPGSCPSCRSLQLFQGPSHPSLPPCQNYQLHSGEVNGGLPSVSGFSSASTAYGVSSHTPPISGTDNMMGMASHQSDALSPWPGTGSPGKPRQTWCLAHPTRPDTFGTSCVTCAWSPCPGKRHSEVLAAGALGCCSGGLHLVG